ncbi:MAG: 30S ribosomal protein S16, partial [Deltaproteobacteria bacterium]|nr:30S ribosomal protein S16 [Deltaproteobacteria bacterium]
DGRVIEEIGKYHPTEDPSYVEVNSERVQYWLSVGAQSFSEDGLARALGWAHGPGEALRACGAALAAGLELSLDLIFGWGGETLPVWERDLLLARDTGAAHVSCYCLTPADGTDLARALAAGEAAPLPREGELADMFLAAGEILGGGGLRRYEVSNLALPGHECRHNLGYWRRQPYLGLGPAAHSFDGFRRWGNVPSLSGWAGALAEGRPPRAFTEEIGPSEARLEALMLGLRLSEGLDEGALAGARALPGLVAGGFLLRGGGRVAPSEKGLLAADYLARSLA